MIRSATHDAIEGYISYGSTVKDMGFVDCNDFLPKRDNYKKF